MCLENPKKPFKLIHKAEDLLKYSRIKPSELKMERVHEARYVELEIQMAFHSGQAYHIMTVDVQDSLTMKELVTVSIYGLDRLYDLTFY